MTRIGVIVNTTAKYHRRHPRAVDAMRRAVGEHGLLAETRTLDELEAAAADFQRQGVDLLAVGGGDGTTSLTLTTFAGVYGVGALPPVAMLRGGTMNTIANSVGVRRASPLRLLSDLVQGAAAGRPLRTTERLAIDVNGRLAFLTGTGAVYGFLHEYYSAGNPFPTPWTAVKTLARGVGSAIVMGETVRRMAAPIEATVTVDGGEPWPLRKYISVAAGTVDQIGLGFRPFYRATEDLQRFHLLGIHTSPAGLVARLPRVWRAKPIGGERHVHEALATEAVIETASGRVNYMVDGDVTHTEGPLVLRAGPRVRFVV